MPEPTSPDARGLDARAVDAAVRRLSRSPGPAWLHAEVARRMAERLQIVRLQPARLIEWWSFLGAGGELLAKAYPEAERVLVEPSEAFAQRSREATRAAWWSPRRWRKDEVAVVVDGESTGAPAQLLWANMMLHAVQDPPALMARWQQALAADGFVMFSCLGPDTARELRALYARLGWPDPTPAFVDMHDLGDMLVQAGFADPVMDQETIILNWATPQAMLEELRGLGANASPLRFQGLRTPRWRRRLEEALAGTAGPDGRVSLRFEVAYGHAFKALPKAPPGQPTTVSLDEMRSLVRSRRK
ncbi:class I SAM-dependent methyltransferase [Piscinibacter terrae]|uniref:Methyltransferase domain-containing protein n=1 Tax=Piscinibacter terrae TaxID=2496871 RepID=A0A3N7HLT9_9BURK|nr:methyltransferase domain-containing protein [Albitalea terrae]RQP21571.1 methyltransferase domain-containing protein [Albitalea terrae]